MIVAKEPGQLLDLLRHFYAAYPIRSTLMILSITVAALAEGLGVASLLPLTQHGRRARGAPRTPWLFMSRRLSTSSGWRYPSAGCASDCRDDHVEIAAGAAGHDFVGYSAAQSP